MHSNLKTYSKTCVKWPLSKGQKLGFKTNYHLMQVKSICRMLQGEHSAILSTFIRLAFVIKIFILPIFEWPFYTGFTVFFKFINNCPAEPRCFDPFENRVDPDD